MAVRSFAGRAPSVLAGSGWAEVGARAQSSALRSRQPSGPPAGSTTHDSRQDDDTTH